MAKKRSVSIPSMLPPAPPMMPAPMAPKMPAAGGMPSEHAARFAKGMKGGVHPVNCPRGMK